MAELYGPLGLSCLLHGIFFPYFIAFGVIILFLRRWEKAAELQADSVYKALMRLLHPGG